MSVRNWHYGKLIILWAWGGFAVTLVFLDFQSSPVKVAPFLHLFEFLFVLIVLAVLSAITWRWLGDRPRDNSAPAKAPDPRSE